jgi:hypothetical protein
MLCTDALKDVTIHLALAGRIPTQNIDCVGLDEPIAKLLGQFLPLHALFLSLSCPEVVPRIGCVDVDVGAFLTMKLSPPDYESIFPRRRIKHVGLPESSGYPPLAIRSGTPMSPRWNRPCTTAGLHPETGTAPPMCHPPGNKGRRKWGRWGSGSGSERSYCQ